MNSEGVDARLPLGASFDRIQRFERAAPGAHVLADEVRLGAVVERLDRILAGPHLREQAANAAQRLLRLLGVRRLHVGELRDRREFAPHIHARRALASRGRSSTSTRW
jgi:hypothetical protein